MINFLKNLRTNEYVVNVLTLMTGTSIAQIIALASSPILTRLYSPTDFGLLAIIMAFVSTFLPAVSGKYEVAMVLPKEEIDGHHLMGISIYFAFILSLLFLFSLLITHKEILALVDSQILGNFIFLAPLILLLSALLSIFTYYANRIKKYNFIAKSKITQALVASLVNIFLGIMGVGFIGLIIGNISALLIANIYIINLEKASFKNDILRLGKRKRELLKNYNDYPLFNATTALLNGATFSLPVFFISHYFPDSIVGFYAVLMKVAGSPISLISSSVSQVNLKKVVDIVSRGNEIEKYLYKLTTNLLLLILLPTIVIIAWAPEIFSFVFGSQWITAGEYAQILMFSISIRFIVSPLSTTLGATKNNRLGAIWKVISFVSTLVVLSLIAPKGNIKLLLYAMLVNDVLLYSFYYCLIIKAARHPQNIL